MKKLALIIVLLTIQTQFAYSQLGGLTVGVILDQIEEKGKSLINEVESSANNVINNAALNLFHAIHQFEDAYGAMLSKTMDELTIQEKQIFDGFKETADDLLYQVENRLLTNVEDRINQLGSYMLNLPFAKNIPYVSKINSPLMYLGDDRLVKVQLKGQLLNHKDNKVTFNGNEIDFRQPTDNLIELNIPTNLLFSHNSNCEKFSRIDVKCHYDESSWFFWTKTLSKNYSIDLRAVEAKVGELTIKYITETIDSKPKTRTESVSGEIDTSPVKRRSGSTGKDIFPAKGYYIDINTVKITEKKGSKYCKSGTIGASVNPKTASKIRLNASAQTNKKTNTSCYYSAKVSFTELLIDPIKTEKDETIVKDLFYNSPVVVELPKNTKAFKLVEIKNCSGNTIKMIKPGIDKSKFLKVSFDNVTKTLKVETLE